MKYEYKMIWQQMITRIDNGEYMSFEIGRVINFFFAIFRSNTIWRLLSSTDIANTYRASQTKMRSSKESSSYVYVCYVCRYAYEYKYNSE